jgi:hypothetical protein
MTVAKTTEEMSPGLLRVAERAKRDPQGKILSLARLIDVPALERAYGRLRKVRDQPAIVPTLLRDVIHVSLPDYSAVRIESADLTQVRPTEYRADLVVLLEGDRPVLGIIVEVQLAPDPKKRASWPVYVATVHARFDCPACLLVVTPRRSVAKWARQPIDLGPGSHFEAIVVGPDALPAIEESEAARRAPELAVLSAMAYGRTGRVATPSKLSASRSLHSTDASTSTQKQPRSMLM